MFWVLTSKFKSGQLVQKKCFSNAKGDALTSNSISSSGGLQIIFINNFHPLSSNSNFIISFDCFWGIGGSGNDAWQSIITDQNNDNIAQQTKILNSDDRNCSLSLFPIKGIYFNTGNTSLTQINFQICGKAISSDDTLSINSANWNCIIEEIQN